MLLKAEEGGKSCRARMRSEKLDVSKLAQALGGGGHKDAAGASIKACFNEAKTILQKEIKGFLQNEQE